MEAAKVEIEHERRRIGAPQAAVEREGRLAKGLGPALAGHHLDPELIAGQGHDRPHDLGGDAGDLAILNIVIGRPLLRHHLILRCDSMCAGCQTQQGEQEDGKLHRGWPGREKFLGMSIAPAATPTHAERPNDWQIL